MAPLVLHLVYRFDTGGLENGVVNLINHMPPGAYRHAVVALTEVAPAFAARLTRGDVECIALHKPPGHALPLYPRLTRLFGQLRPAVVHTRNLAALECQVPAAWAGIPARVHGEHGRDSDDPRGEVRRYQWMRRAYRPFVHRYVALSRELEQYLRDRVGVPSSRIARIVNGADTQRFAPAGGARADVPGWPFSPSAPLFVVGTVGRMQTVKAQPLLARAFVRALELAPALRRSMRLVMVGEGALRAEAQAILDGAGVSALAWLPGERGDVPELMRALDAFVLPSLAEGISNTILEAMASGLPVLATRVGGNAELVEDGVVGRLVEAGDMEALAQGLVALAGDPARARALGAAGRARAERQFSLQAMVAAYQSLYDGLLAQRRWPARQSVAGT